MNWTNAFATYAIAILVPVIVCFSFPHIYKFRVAAVIWISFLIAALTFHSGYCDIAFIRPAFPADKYITEDMILAAETARRSTFNWTIVIALYASGLALLALLHGRARIIPDNEKK